MWSYMVIFSQWLMKEIFLFVPCFFPLLSDYFASGTLELILTSAYRESQCHNESLFDYFGLKSTFRMMLAGEKIV